MSKRVLKRWEPCPSKKLFNNKNIKMLAKSITVLLVVASPVAVVDTSPVADACHRCHNNNCVS